MPLVVVGIGSWLRFTGPDVVTSHYATKLDAEKNSLFGRGWLPDFIPASSREIVTHNDLDLNTSDGGFDCKPEELPAFIQRLRPYTAGSAALAPVADRVAAMKAKGYAAYYYRDQDTVWVFYVEPVKGHVDYVTWLVR